MRSWSIVLRAGESWYCSFIAQTLLTFYADAVKSDFHFIFIILSCYYNWKDDQFGKPVEEGRTLELAVVIRTEALGECHALRRH